MCCEGVLHSHVRVYAQEEEHIRKAGIPLRKTKDGNFIFILPCVYFSNNTCSIHATKPAVCRNYHCALQIKVMNGSETVDEALSIITRVKQSAKKLVKQVKHPKNRNAADLNLRNYLYFYLDKIEDIRTQRDIALEEQAFINDAFEYAKLIDRYFIKTKLLTKYADLILNVAAETEAGSSIPTSTTRSRH